MKTNKAEERAIVSGSLPVALLVMEVNQKIGRLMSARWFVRVAGNGSGIAAVG